MKFMIVLACIAIAAVVMTYVRYQSLHPCDWMEQDLAQETDLPRLAVQAKIRASFVIDGILDPDSLDCVLAWWEFRANGLPDGS